MLTLMSNPYVSRSFSFLDMYVALLAYAVRSFAF